MTSERHGSGDSPLADAICAIGRPETADRAENERRGAAMARVHAELRAMVRRSRRTGHPCDDQREDFASIIVIRLALAGPSPDRVPRCDAAANAYLWNALVREWISCWRRAGGKGDPPCDPLVQDPSGGSRRAGRGPRTVPVEDVPDVPGPSGATADPAPATDDVARELRMAHETIRGVALPELLEDGRRADGARALKETVDWLYDILDGGTTFQSTLARLFESQPAEPGETPEEKLERLRDRLHQKCHRALAKNLLPWVALAQGSKRVTEREAFWLRAALAELRPFDRPPTKPRKRRDPSAPPPTDVPDSEDGA